MFTENLAIPVPGGFPNSTILTIDLSQFPKPTTGLGTDVSFILRAGSTTGNVIGFGSAFTIFP